jgi:hypothetical protein
MPSAELRLNLADLVVEVLQVFLQALDKKTQRAGQFVGRIPDYL